MLSRESWQKLPASLELVLSDVDRRGNDLDAFLAAADLLVLRDGGVLLLVLPPDHLWPSEGDRQQALRQGDRLSLPRLQLIPRSHVLRWDLPRSDGLPLRITWREANTAAPPISSPAADGALPGGLLPGSDAEAGPQDWLYCTLSLTESGIQLRREQLLHDPQSLHGWRCQTRELRHYGGISQLPALWYSSDGAAFGEGDLPHLGLAHQYLNHFRCQSDYQELLSRCALPVGVRIGVVGLANASSPTEPVVLGPNTVMDLPEGASFQFVEVQARSLAEHRVWLQHLDEAMRRDALIPSSTSGVSRTAMEISMAASQAYALLQSQAVQKASLFTSLLQHWCAISGDVLPKGAGLQVSVSPLTPPIPPQPSVGEWLEMEARGVIDRDELRRLLALSTSVQAGPTGSPAEGLAPSTQASP